MRRVPAVLVCDAATGNLEVAGLTVLDRLVVTAHRAGCEPITVVSDEPPALTRSAGLKIKTVYARALSKDEAAPSALEVTGGLLIEAKDLQRLIAAGGKLTAKDGEPLPVRLSNLDAPLVIATGLTHVINDAASAIEAETKLWASLESSADGLVDRYLNRPIGRPLSRFLVRTSISPNQISVVSILVGIASAWFFATGAFVLGAVVLQFCAIIDCIDGDVARAALKQSPLGKWLDLAGDQVVHFSVFAAIGIGVARSNPSVPALALGASAALGVIFSFAVIVRALRQPAGERGALLNKLLDSTANRDFSVLLLVLALIGKMELFLWLAGTGIHLFWIALLVLQSGRARPALSREAA